MPARPLNVGPLAATMTRETEQLLAVANHYLAEARGGLATKPQLTFVTIGEITRKSPEAIAVSG